MKPFTYDGETCHIRDNITLVQALERCAAAYRNRCLGTEHPNPMWVKLYVASQRLHQGVRQNEVARSILEIGSNLMGCDDMAILELHGASELSLLACAGMTAERRRALAANAGAIASVIEAGQISIVNADTTYSQLWLQLGVTAFVPVRHENRRGAVLFYRFLSPRSDLDLADRELLRLLSMFSGPSLFSA